MSPEAMLYNEPTTGLDPIMSAVINELIVRTRSRYSVTSVVVTHDMQTVTKVADRVVMLHPLARLEDDEPQVIFDGGPDELQRCKDLRVAQFGRRGRRTTDRNGRAAGSRCRGNLISWRNS